MAPETALSSLLLRIFESDELRRFLADGDNGDEIKQSLPHSSVSPAQLTFAAVDILRHRNLIDDGFFQRLEDARPRRAAEIRQVQHLWDTIALVPEDLDDPLAGFKTQLITRIGHVASIFRTPDGPIQVSDVYVDLQLDTTARGDRSPRAADLPRWSALLSEGSDPHRLGLPDVIASPHKRWVLIGDPGSGKTTLLQHEAARLVARHSPPDGLVPVLLRVAELRVGDSLRTAISRSYGEAHLGALDHARRNGRLVVLLDGLDEAARPVDGRRAVADLSVDVGDCPILLTSRPTDYIAPTAAFRELYLRPLHHDEQFRLLAAWVPEPQRVQVALAQLHARPRLRRMAENPLLLTLVGLLLRGEDEPLPARRSKLYSQALGILLHKSHHDDDDDRRLADPDTARRALAAVALALHGEGDASHSAESLRTILERDAHLKAAIDRDWPNLRTFIRDVARTTGILEPDPFDRQQERYHFSHRTFREFLAATGLHADIQTHGLGEVPELLHGTATRSGATISVDLPPGELARVLTEGTRSPAVWAEVLALSCGLLGAGMADGLVRRVAATGSVELVQRVVAEAEEVSPDTVAAVLGLKRGGWSWRRRRDVLFELPGLVSDPGVATNLLSRFAETTTDGNDLWFAREALRRISRGDYLGAATVSAEVRREAMVLADRILALPHLQPGLSAFHEWARDRWAHIPAGAFIMGSPDDEPGRFGSEGPRHPVSILHPFLALRTPVTNRAYELLDPDHRADRAGGGTPDSQDDHPVHSVTWFEAMIFAERVGARLPTEAEWEYCCRAGTSTRAWPGNADSDLERAAWFNKNSNGTTHPVGTLQANPFGLYDVHGNVWEWCLDDWIDSYQGRERGISVDPEAPPTPSSTGTSRPIRGGSWEDPARDCRSAFRYGDDPGDRGAGLGFRLVRRVST